MPATDPGSPFPAVRPFLKWAGGKRQLLPHLRAFYPATFHAYFEPFLGSGAVFFDLWQQGRLTGRPVTLIDENVDLIGCYRAVRDEVEHVIAALAGLEAGHARGGAAHYYEVRDGRFNPQRLRVGEAPDPAGDYGAALAAMLIYLNRTGYNGLFRLNSKGRYNVPAGRYARPAICDAGNLRRVSAVLRSPGVTLRHGSYVEACEAAGPGDLLYFDPPYAPVSRTASFTSYTARGFSSADQAALQQRVVALARKGCTVLVSNSTAADIAALYESSADARSAGLHAHRVRARRAINSRPGGRGVVEEFVVSNVPAASAWQEAHGSRV